jgi:hypothetical protein
MAEYEEQSCDENRDTLPDYELRATLAASPKKGSAA